MSHVPTQKKKYFVRPLCVYCPDMWMELSDKYILEISIRTHFGTEARAVTDPKIRGPCVGAHFAHCTRQPFSQESHRFFLRNSAVSFLFFHSPSPVQTTGFCFNNEQPIIHFILITGHYNNSVHAHICMYWKNNFSSFYTHTHIYARRPIFWCSEIRAKIKLTCMDLGASYRARVSIYFFIYIYIYVCVCVCVRVCVCVWEPR
jgi:hypothetical protein